MDLFTKIEFDEIMSNLEKDMEEIVKQELTIFYRMSGVMVQMLMFEAENNQLTLNADVSYMENYKALDEMKDYENLTALEAESGGNK